ncbi:MULTISPECIES: hypothetical protein [unclassified Gordonia (in: high G+C Gram-positive bacteria)]|uniref:hypothetical protein n=1 Tax=unclassified Gordonia (in: high G+C Gram-positive bacteria) TaxID=2657482 RepID=UPI001F10A362|nr:hypothetical protein [Gordonia sp. ABSL49_1]MCH5644161.1 hypothetical protein [Gordonia sp. ABSL49_1]
MSPFTSIFHFGIDQQEITEIADTWHRQHVAVHAISFEAFGSCVGPSSAVVDALGAARQPAASATASIGKRLGDMSGLLRAFNVEATDSDARAAAGFDQLRTR